MPYSIEEVYPPDQEKGTGILIDLVYLERSRNKKER
jgi:hypothetical protein